MGCVRVYGGVPETGDLRFLNTAQRLADYYLANVPSDYVPYWDFQAPGIPNAQGIPPAASIMLSALVQLSQLTTNQLKTARGTGKEPVISSILWALRTIWPRVLTAVASCCMVSASRPLLTIQR